MKLIFLSALVVLVTIFKYTESKMTIEQIKVTMKPYRNSCNKKTSIDEALVEGTKTGQFPPDRTLMCWQRCFLQMMKVMKDGEISLEAIDKTIDFMIPDDLSGRMRDICVKCQQLTLSVEDTCEKAWTFIKCFYETDSELYFFI